MPTKKEVDYTILVIMVVVSIAILSIIALKSNSPTGYVVFDGNEETLKTQVGEFVRRFPLTALAGDGAEVCLIITAGSEQYTFDLFKSNGNVEVTAMPYSRYCDNDFNNKGSEDIVIQYVDYDSFVSHLNNPSCELLKSTGAGEDFYYLPSEFVEVGGIPVCNALFQERYCPAVRACASAAEMKTLGFGCCLLGKEQPRSSLTAVLTNKYLWFFIFLFLFGFTIILVVYLIEQRKEQKDKESFEKCVRELKHYIDYCLESGRTEKEVREILLRQGWANDIVDYVFGLEKPASPPPK